MVSAAGNFSMNFSLKTLGFSENMRNLVNFDQKELVKVHKKCELFGLHLELEPLVVPADSGTLKFPLVGWDFSEIWVLSGLFLL
jgi:hypothetical protein